MFGPLKINGIEMLPVPTHPPFWVESAAVRTEMEKSLCCWAVRPGGTEGISHHHGLFLAPCAGFSRLLSSI